MRNSATVGEALRALLLHLNLHDRGAVPILINLDASYVLLGYSIYRHATPGTPHLYDAAIAIGYRALKGICGTALAAVFLASGLLHEVVITLPARGGYGLPTAYFALQAVGLFVERLTLIRRRPWLKRLFAWFVLLAPLGCLFPPVFVRNVILPMLHVGATPSTP